MESRFDIVIVGGGLVGASLAAALGPLPFKIALIEAVPLRSSGQPSYDARSTAVSNGSQTIFRSIGVWEGMVTDAEPIRSIHVSDRGRFGFTHLDCREHGVAALGYVVENRAIGAALWDHLSARSNIELISPARVLSVSNDTDASRLELERDGTGQIEISTRLVIAADGANSLVRSALGIPAERTEYEQTAVIANFTPGRHHEGVAYERFTPSGPLAALPLSGGRCAMVWTVASDASAEVMRLGDEDFIETFLTQFGYRLGIPVKVGQRHAYPLSLIVAEQIVAGRAAIVGNAAHGLHPIAGQGFNLGLRDVATLADVLDSELQNQGKGIDPGAPRVLAEYENWRRRDQRRTIALTDGLVRLFANSLGPVKLARDVGMVAMDLLPGLKPILARQSMGVSGRLPRLARGLPLVGERRHIER